MERTISRSRRTPPWVAVILIIVIIIMAFFLFKNGGTFSDKGFTNETVTGEEVKAEKKSEESFMDSVFDYYSDSGNLQLDAAAYLRNKIGKCQRTLLPDHIKVKVMLKGKNFRIREFLCNGLEYISSRCFDQKTDSIAMENFIPYDPQQSSIPFSISFHSLGVTNNEYEFFINVFDSNNKLIGKYPQQGADKVIKDKIRLLSQTMSYRDAITITP